MAGTANFAKGKLKSFVERRKREGGVSLDVVEFHVRAGFVLRDDEPITRQPAPPDKTIKPNTP